MSDLIAMIFPLLVLSMFYLNVIPLIILEMIVLSKIKDNMPECISLHYDMLQPNDKMCFVLSGFGLLKYDELYVNAYNAYKAPELFKFMSHQKYHLT